ncbi:hypothetical protein DPMN_146878 [Dreissena polymorpha]|uniref:Uncharacterized protein n=1 Tax=Dreissena polymorpha TaxID=45954 RepID=A0A9D4J043_DREPO|nr:hypothetical protein DPMN_146878 [Dreissena polymorpha]
MSWGTQLNGNNRKMKQRDGHSIRKASNQSDSGHQEANGTCWASKRDSVIK